MAPKNKASVSLRGKHQKHDTEEGDDNNIVKVQMVLGLISLGCFLLSLYSFDRGNDRESDPTKLDLMMVYSAYIVLPLVFVKSCLRCSLSMNHPIWCFVVEMFQASSSSLTMIGSIQISIMKDEEENFLCCLGFLIASLILVEIIIDDTEDCGVCDMLVALFLKNPNTKHPKYVPVVCGISYLSRRLGIFMMKQLKNERAESKEENSEQEVKELREAKLKNERAKSKEEESEQEAKVLREAKEISHMDALNEMSGCLLATEKKLATGQPKSDLEMKYPEFFRMGVQID